MDSTRIAEGALEAFIVEVFTRLKVAGHVAALAAQFPVGRLADGHRFPRDRGAGHVRDPPEERRAEPQQRARPDHGTRRRRSLGHAARNGPGRRANRHGTRDPRGARQQHPPGHLPQREPPRRVRRVRENGRRRRNDRHRFATDHGLDQPVGWSRRPRRRVAGRLRGSRRERFPLPLRRRHGRHHPASGQGLPAEGLDSAQGRRAGCPGRADAGPGEGLGRPAHAHRRP